MSSSPNPAPAKSPFSTVGIIVVLALIVAGGGYYYFLQSSPAPAPVVDFLSQIERSMAGGDKLHESLKDENGDLLADTPTDPAKLIDPETLVFVALAGDKDKDNWKDFSEHLGKVTGKKIETSFESLANRKQFDDLREGKKHILGLSTGSVQPAVNIGGFIPIVAIADEKGVYTYNVRLIVSKGSPIKELKDLKGKEIKLASAKSLSGFKYPITYLHSQFKWLPGPDYSYTISGGHIESIKVVAKASPPAAAFVAGDLLDREIETKKVDPSQFSVIFTSEPFVQAAYGYAHNLKPELAAKIKEAFMTFSFKGTSLAKSFSDTHKFVPVDYKKDWEPVRKIEEQLNLIIAESSPKAKS